MKKIALILLSLLFSDFALADGQGTITYSRSNIFCITTSQPMTLKQRSLAHVLSWSPGYLKIVASPLASTHTTQVADLERLI